MFSNTFLKFFFLFLSVMGASQIRGNTKTYHNDTIIDKNLLYYSTHPENDPLSLPLIKINTEEKIRLSFDYKGEYTDFSYKIIHCDYKWDKSEINEFEYIDGFIDNQITDYENSFNTNINYCHYNINIPNQDIKLKKSGNYKIIVYKDYNEDDIVFISSFSIIEPLIDIKGRVKPASNPKYVKTSQEIDFEINHSRIKLFNPSSDLEVFVWQNGDCKGSKIIKPSFIRNNTLSYNYNQENIFEGGNEFRNFNIQNFKYLSRYIKNVEYNGDEVNVYLFPNYNRFYKPYIYERDINGFYIIKAENKTDPNVESDYANVNFILAMDNPLDKEIYVFGALSNWNISEKFKMKYNLKIRAYTLNTLLKQGYYNYKYVVYDKKMNKIDKSFIEGSHYETENDYFVAVYFRDISKNYDRLVGYKRFNSSNVKTMK